MRAGVKHIVQPHPAAQTLRKKAFPQQRKRKKRLPKRAHVLFSAPILFALRRTARVVTNQNPRGVPQNGEKGWRTD
jgi:hypothetical protein